MKEFTFKNNGKLQIISNDGFYQFNKANEITQSFEGEFPGTIVNLQFRTDDTKSYILKKELDVNNIF